MTELRVGLIGAGRAGRVHALNLARYVSGARPTAVIDSNEEAARRQADEIGGAQVFTDVDTAMSSDLFDAVVITTPTFTHRDFTVQAAAAGKHVFCEKPMSLTPSDCRTMIDACEAGGVILQIGFMRRFQPEFVEAKRRIAGGEIGEPMIIKSLTRGPGLPPNWAWNIDRSNGMLAEVNSHDYDCVRWLVGSDIERVYAETANRKGAARGVDVDRFYDNAVVTLRFEDQTLGTIDGTCPADYGYDARVEVLGSRGLLVIGDVRGQAILEVLDRDIGAVTPVHRTWPERFAEGYRHEMESFVDSVSERKPAAVTGEDGLKAVAAVIASNLSWQEERPVGMSEVMTK